MKELLRGVFTRRRAGRSLLLASAVGGVFALGAAQPAGAATSCSIATITWDGSAGTSWHTAANWDQNRVPTATDHVCIPAGTTSSATFSTGSTSVLSVEVRVPLTISAGTLTITSTTQSSSFAKKVTIAGGTLAGAADRTFKGGAEWSTGTLRGPGQTIVPANKTLAVSGTVAKTLAGPVLNRGTFRVAGSGALHFGDNAVVTNEGTIELGGTAPLVGGFGTGPWQIENTPSGTITKTSGAVTLLDVAIDNDGVVRSDVGRLELNQGTGAGQVSSATYGGGAGTLVFGGDQPHTMGAGAVVVGPTPVEVNGTNVTLVGPLAVTSGATLRWINGDIHGGTTAPTAARVAPGGTLTIEAAGTKFLEERLTNDGTIAISSDLSFDNHALLTNNATITLTGDDDDLIYGFGSGPWQIVNTATGTIAKTSGVLSRIDVPLDNDGVVRADAGRLELKHGTGVDHASSGDYGGGAGTLAFAADQVHTMEAGAAIVGASPVELNGTSVALAGPLAVTSGATLRWIDGDLFGGTTEATAARVVAGGTLSVEGIGTKFLEERVTNDGTMAINGDLNLSTHARLTNNATMTFAGDDDDVSYGFGLGPWQIVNTATGTITKTAGVLSTIDAPLDNDGDVRANVGRLELAHGTGAGQASAGDYGGGAGTVVFVNEPHTMTAAARIVAGSPVEINGTNVVLAGPFTVRPGATLRWIDGDIIGGSTLPSPTTPTRIDAGGTLTIETGATKFLHEGLTNDGTITVDGDLSLRDHALLTNNALIDLTGDHDRVSFGFGSGPWQLVNTAPGIIRKSAGLQSTIDAAVDNDGVVRSDAGRLELTHGSGGHTSAGQFGGGNGTVAFLDGAHLLAATATLVGPAAIELNGTNVNLTGPFTVVAGATLRWIDGDVIGGATTPTPTTPARIAAGAAVTIEGAPTKFLHEGLTNDGTMTVDGDLSFSNHGLLTNNGTIHLTGDDDDFSFGFGSGPWRFVNNVLGVVHKTEGLHSDLNVDLTNRGTVIADAGTTVVRRPLDFTGSTLTAGTWRVSATLQFTGKNLNANGAALALTGPAAAVMRTDALSALDAFASNTGRLDLAGAPFALPAFTNRGTLTLATATTLSVPTYTQLRGVTHIASGGTLAPAGGLDLHGGAITGRGSVQGDLRNTGSSPPVALRPDRYLTVTGTYTQGAAGVFEATVDGAGTGNAQRRLRATGACTIGGTLSVDVAPDFVGTVGDQFLLASCGGRTGKFVTVEVETPDEALVFEPYYTATGVGVTLVAAP